MRLGFAILLWSATVLADEEPRRGAIAGVVVDAASSAPLSGVSVIVTADRGHAVVAGQTDAGGRFSVPGLPPGSYEVLFLLGGARELRSAVPVNAQVTTPLVGKLPVDVDEITIHERLPVTVAKPVSSTVKKVLPYSDEAVDTNSWAVGWLLLDVAADGRVTGFRFLHRPGHQLEEIAEKEVWGLRFEPARAADGSAVASRILWKMEWPAYWWRMAKETQNRGLYRPMYVTRRPGGDYNAIQQRARRVAPLIEVRGAFLLGQAQDRLPPCQGDGPLDLDDPDHVYRDCPKPDLSRATTEPVVRRPPGR